MWFSNVSHERNQSLWQEFIEKKYNGGHKKVLNPNKETRDQFPTVTFYTAVQYESGGKKPFLEQVYNEYYIWRDRQLWKEYKAWQDKAWEEHQAWQEKAGKPSKPEPLKKEVHKALAEVNTWSEKKKAREFWKLPTQKEPPVPLWMTRPTPWKGMSAGAVVFNEQGKILLREPTKQFGGYAWTFPKGGRDKDKVTGNYKESLGEAARREVQEETGWGTNLHSVIPETFEGTSTTTLMYVGHAGGQKGEPDKETQGLKWVDFDEAVDLILQTKNKEGRKRDLKILVEAMKQRNLALAQNLANRKNRA